MMDVRPLRSALYLPASNARAIEKARLLPCDAVILDLEDSVAPDAKAASRDRAVAAVREGGFGDRRLVVRVNALATPWGAADVAAVAAVRPDAILLPKIDSGSDVAQYTALLDPDNPLPLWVMLETARSMLRLEDIASAVGLTTLVVGTNDLARELGAKIDAERLGVLGMLALSVAAARAFGLVILDGVCNDLDDSDALARECEQGARLGFDGKTLVHPKQIDPCNTAFSPAASEVEWASAIVVAFDRPENQAAGVIRIEGRMAERLHLDQARKTLAIAAAIAARH